VCTASFAAECLAALFSCFLSSALFGLITGFCQAFAQMPPKGIYSDVAYLTLSRERHSPNHSRGIELKMSHFNTKTCKYKETQLGYLFASHVILHFLKLLGQIDMFCMTQSCVKEEGHLQS